MIMEVNIKDAISTNVEIFVKTKFNDKLAFVLGAAIEKHIKERTVEGLDKNDQPFKPYSTKPFALPAAAVPKYAIKKLQSATRISYFKRNGILFATVKSGYAKYKMMLYAKTSYNGVVNLTLTGSMLRSFALLSAKANQIVLGFHRKQAAALYYYNVLKGRDMLGITRKNLIKITDKIINNYS